jgi:predicted enzyme involved in methoxymalonyl-ACP biosynthesis
MAYRDKFGPLGKIAALSGRLADRSLFVDIWVMSCRAFARHIEHAALKHLFDRYAIDEIRFDLVATGRNTPMMDLFRFYLGEAQAGPVRLSRERFVQACPPLFHQTKDTAHAHG